jgi:Zn-dependent peptidase ImmA (M78 family)
MSTDIQPYLDNLKTSGYPEEYIALIIEHVQRLIDNNQLIVKEDAHPRYDASNKTIILPLFDQLPDSNVAHLILVHELTHALRQDTIVNSRECDYLSYMRRKLEEECVAVSSENYGWAKSFTLQMVKAEQLAGLTVCLRYTHDKHREILIEAAIYTIVTQNIYHGEREWTHDYTKYYNTANKTNYKPPENGFEPPMLPPMLARLVRDTLKNINNENPGIFGNMIARAWMTLMNLRPQSLELAAAQTTWPTYKSEVLAGMSTNSNSLG